MGTALCSRRHRVSLLERGAASPVRFASRFASSIPAMLQLLSGKMAGAFRHHCMLKHPNAEINWQHKPAASRTTLYPDILIPVVSCPII